MFDDNADCQQRFMSGINVRPSNIVGMSMDARTILYRERTNRTSDHMTSDVKGQLFD